MALIVIDAKHKNKRSTVPGVVPVLGTSENHTDGSWDDNMIYTGELFFNIPDQKLWIGGELAIVQIPFFSDLPAPSSLATDNQVIVDDVRTITTVGTTLDKKLVIENGSNEWIAEFLSNRKVNFFNGLTIGDGTNSYAKEINFPQASGTHSLAPYANLFDYNSVYYHRFFSNGNFMLQFGDYGHTWFRDDYWGTAATAHNYNMAGSTILDKRVWKNSAGAVMLSVNGVGTVTGGAAASGNDFVLGFAGGHIASQGSFSVGSIDFNSNFRFNIYGNSEIAYQANHVSGNNLMFGYYGRNTWSIYKGGTSPSTLHGMIGTEEIRTGINATDTNIENSACAQFESTTQGFLPPRMTTREKNAIVSPANGLVVFDTVLDNLYIYKTSAGAWVAV